VYPYLVRIGYGYALDTPRIRSKPYPKILDTYYYEYVYPIRGPNHQTAQYSTLLWRGGRGGAAATATECEGEAEEWRRQLLRTGGRGGAAVVAAEGMGRQMRGCDRRQRSLPHALPSRAAPLDPRRLGPCRGARVETAATGPSPVFR